MAENSVITREIRDMIGVEAGPVTYQVEDWMIRRFADVIDDPNPLWVDREYAQKKGFKDIVAPQTFLLNYFNLDQDEWARLVKCPLPNILAGGSETECFLPVSAGEHVTVSGKLVEAKEREGKGGKLLFLIFERSYINQHGELVTRARQTFVRH
jgi:acyl dehydratase